MKELILHIGHNKTGTSYLQAMLANNADGLHRIDANYPPNHSLKSQNGADHWWEWRHTAQRRYPSHYMFEDNLQQRNFFSELINGELTGELAKNYKLRGDFVFQRDVFAHSFSRWGQQVKRRGCTETVDAFLCRSPDGPYRAILIGFRSQGIWASKSYLEITVDQSV